MGWTEQEKSFVWSRAEEVFGVDPAKFRKDSCGAWMGWEFYGDRNSPFGWEIDHVSPGGGNSLSNLQALQWDNNVAKSDGQHRCPVTAQGNQNVRRW